MSDILKKEDLNPLNLRNLYERFGYVRYKMKKFEAYDLYVANKDFLASDSIITFTDTDGTLLALKPDVTLSIIKNYRAGTEGVQKVYYNENIYRPSKSTRTYKEIMQMGLECMGNLDMYDIGEVLVLADRSLAALSDSYILALSHMGIIRGLLEGLDLSSENGGRLFGLLREKNRHGIRLLGKELGLSEKDIETIITLVSAYGPMDEVLKTLRSICLNSTMDDAIKELECLYGLLASQGLDDHIQMDFSIVNDMSYYNGVLFRGYIDGIPSGVLSGGQYDELMEKMGKHAGAIGFAINMDLISSYETAADEYDLDILLLYDDSASPAKLMETVSSLADDGYKVQAQRQIPEKLRFKKLMKFTEGDVAEIEKDD